MCVHEEVETLAGMGYARDFYENIQLQDRTKLF